MFTLRRLLFAISLVLVPAASALAQVCPAGSTCATLDSYTGGHISLGGALTTAGALTTTGAASGATLAFPVGGPFTFTLPSTSKTLLATDLSNIGAGILPIGNLTALTASHFFAGDVSNRPIDASITGDMGCGTAAAGFVTCTVTGIRGTSIAAIGTGVPTALGINVGTAGSFLTNGGALAGSSLTSTGLIKTTGADGSQLEIAGAGLTDFKLSVNASGFYVNDVTNSKSPLIVSANSPNSLTIGTSTNAFIGPITDGANGGTVGSLKLFGNTSGDVTVVAAAAAGTATRFQLPATNGSNTNVLQTDGSGNTSWAAAGGGSTGFGVDGGTSSVTVTTTGTVANATRLEKIGTLAGAIVRTLPAISAVSADTCIRFEDAGANVTPTNTLTITANAADGINNGAGGSSTVAYGTSGLGVALCVSATHNWNIDGSQLANPSSGQIYIGSAAGFPIPQTLSQDCTLVAAGTITCTKTNNVAFAASATTDTTNAANISSGALPLARIGASAASHAIPVDVAGTSTYKVVPDCQDSAGNHINYTQSTDAFSCGTTSSGGGGGTVVQNAITGLILSNDGATPNSKLDISAGQAADTTNAVYIAPAAFTKTTSGAWTSGSGNAGMGNGLTVASGTWYFVCLANNGGAADYWFDTSSVCSNKPAGISDTKLRVVGMFSTCTATLCAAGASTNIATFKSLPVPGGVRTFWIYTNSTGPGSGLDVSLQTVNTASRSLFTLSSVPTGYKVVAYFNATDGGNGHGLRFSSPDEPDLASGNDATNSPSAGVIPDYVFGAAGYNRTDFHRATNTSAQIAVRAGATCTSCLTVQTRAWDWDRGINGS